jgi:hypothetical protein
MPWHTDDAGLPSLDLSREKVPLARSAARAADGAQDAPALGLVPWTSGGSLFAVWEDGSRTFGPSQRRPDVVAHVVPLPVLRITEGESHDF